VDTRPYRKLRPFSGAMELMTRPSWLFSTDGVVPLVGSRGKYPVVHLLGRDPGGREWTVMAPAAPVYYSTGTISRGARQNHDQDVMILIICPISTWVACLCTSRNCQIDYHSAWIEGRIRFRETRNFGSRAKRRVITSELQTPLQL
jgi:hypothetical protein